MAHLFVILLGIYLAAPCYGEDLQADGPAKFDSNEDLMAESALELSQEELLEEFQSWWGVRLGSGHPWELSGLYSTWANRDASYRHSFGVGGSRFEFSNTLHGSNYFLAIEARSASVSTRHYFTSFAPFYYGAVVQINNWSGEIRPKGNDLDASSSASSLNSDFSLLGASLGLKSGFTWFWEWWGLDIALLQASQSVIFSEAYTNNTSEARQIIRRQVREPINWSGINLGLIRRF